MFTFVAQAVDSESKRRLAANLPLLNRLILLGTAPSGSGTVAVRFDDHTANRCSSIVVPPFTAPQVYAMLNGERNPADFVSLWSCFGGIPGHYDRAKQNNVWSNGKVNPEELVLFSAGLSGSVPDDERTLFRALGERGCPESQVDNKKAGVLERLLARDSISRVGNGKSAALIPLDMAVMASVVCTDTKLVFGEKLNILRGVGLESLTRSVALEVLASLQINVRANSHSSTCLICSTSRIVQLVSSAQPRRLVLRQLRAGVQWVTTILIFIVKGQLGVLLFLSSRTKWQT
jgi:hypothetical protein